MTEKTAQDISVFDGSAWKTLKGQKVYDGTAWKTFQGVYDGVDWIRLARDTYSSDMQVSGGIWQEKSVNEVYANVLPHDVTLNSSSFQFNSDSSYLHYADLGITNLLQTFKAEFNMVNYVPYTGLMEFELISIADGLGNEIVVKQLWGGPKLAKIIVQINGIKYETGTSDISYYFRSITFGRESSTIAIELAHPSGYHVWPVIRNVNMIDIVPSNIYIGKYFSRGLTGTFSSVKFTANLLI